MLRVACFVGTGLLIGTADAAEPLPGVSLESLLAVARDKNPDLAAARLEAEAAAERVQPAGALPDPVLRLELENLDNSRTTSVSLSPARVGDTKYTVMQNLPAWGKRDLRRQMAQSEADQVRQKATDAWLELAARLKSAYADWWLNGRNSRLNRELLGLVENLEKVAQVRYAAGLAPQQDAIRAQVERTALMTDRLMLEHERHTLTALINTLLSRPASAALAEPQALPPLPAAARLSSTALAEKLTARSPVLQSEAARVEGARAGRDLAYRNRYPDLTVGVVPMQVGNGINSWSLMFEASIPLQQASHRSQERESERSLAAAEARRAALANRLQAELENALAGLQAAQETEDVAGRILLPQAELAYQSALSGYENGKLDFATLLDAQRQVRLAKQALYKAQATQRSRLADIERLTGEGE